MCVCFFFLLFFFLTDTSEFKVDKIIHRSLLPPTRRDVLCIKNEIYIWNKLTRHTKSRYPHEITNSIQNELHNISIRDVTLLAFHVYESLLIIVEGRKKRAAIDYVLHIKEYSIGKLLDIKNEMMIIIDNYSFDSNNISLYRSNK